MKSIFIVAAGSGLGGILRYGIQQSLQKYYPSIFPAGTFVVNIAGCLLIGVCIALSEKNGLLRPMSALFLITGLCGGFTTFSSFAAENVSLLKSGNLAIFSLYTISSFAIGILATFLGMYIAR